MPRTILARGPLRLRAARVALATFIILAPSQASADEPPAALSVSSGLSRGVVRELVFEGDSILSELTWPMDNAVSLGLEADVPLRSSFRLRGSLTVGIPMRTGSMVDSDFMNLPDSGEQTHYSRHDALLRHAIAVSLNVSRPVTTGLSGPLTERKLVVTPEIGARYSSRAWSARDGYLQYGELSGSTYEPWTPELPRVPVSGTVITYRLTSLALSARVSLLVPVADRWVVSLNLAGGPILSATGLDEHILRALTFEDTLAGGWFIEPGVGVSCATGPRSALSLSVVWEKTGNLRGDTEIREEGVPGSSTVPNGGGSDSSVVTARLGYTVRLARRATGD